MKSTEQTIQQQDIGKMLELVLPKERIKTRLIDIVSYAADAGFYYLQPQAVVLPDTEDEIIRLFQFSHRHHIPLTFRAAGTSLSGQAITNGILVDISRYWRNIRVENEGEAVRVQPGVIGAMVNAHLKKYHKKIGPDPASINSAMMGGILSNNASGMCCGVSKNSYHTARHIRFILPGGHSFNTETAADYERFENECPAIYHKLGDLRDRIKKDETVFSFIRDKYKTKNTVGYSVNAFIDYDHPLDILAHLLIGAEGTLGFIAEAVMQTVPDYPVKSTALLYFTNIFNACAAIVPLSVAGAEAVELMDRHALRSVEHMQGIPEIIKTLPDTAAALLVEFQGKTVEEVEVKIAAYHTVAAKLAMVNEPLFTTDPVQQAFLWKIRKGMFPAVGAIRKTGTTVILEDIAVPVANLGNAILDLQTLFRQYEYDNAIIFGHAKDGNIHFVVTQAFDSAAEVERYDRFLRDVVTLVVHQYQGALKAEHGTGRNMAPFVQTEWGPVVYDIMRELKAVIDPQNLLNPGVIINDDNNAHIQHLKDLPQVEEEVDKCIECGFCEHKCPSRDVTLTPRRRIVVRRKLAQLKETGYKKEHQQLLQQYQYDGLDTCAVDGLCATACPVDINTGALVKRLRKESHSTRANKLAVTVARNFKTVTVLVKLALQGGGLVNRVLGKNTMHRFTKGIKKIIPAFPLWSNQLSAAPALKKYTNTAGTMQTAVVYFPTCINRVMGPANGKTKSLIDTFFSVSAKAGVQVIVPDNIKGNCCGQIFSSKGFSKAHSIAANDTVEKLWQWTNNGSLPVVLDVSSCTQTLQQAYPVLSTDNKIKFDKLRILDSVNYIQQFIVPAIPVQQKKASVVLHPVCSLQKMGLSDTFVTVAKVFATDVTVPVHAGCCGMAGDRGFLFPELTRSAVAEEVAEVNTRTHDGYYSSGKTCEMALSDAAKKNYESILYLVDECTGFPEKGSL